MAYVFDPTTLHGCVKEGVGRPREEAMDVITQALVREYGDHVDPGPRRWILNNAGGAMGQLTLLHCSLTEYLIFFGTPIGTEGHSGRYATDVYDWVFDGEMWVYLEGETDRTVFDPGSQAYLGPDQVKGYRIPDHSWMLEYARGPIATMLPFGLADTVVSTLDFKTLAKTLRGYTEKSLASLRKGKL